MDEESMSLPQPGGNELMRSNATASLVVLVLKDAAVAKLILFDLDPKFLFGVVVWDYALREQRRINQGRGRYTTINPWGEFDLR